MTLNELKLENEGKILNIECSENIKRRLLDLGLVKNTNIIHQYVF